MRSVLWLLCVVVVLGFVVVCVPKGAVAQEPAKATQAIPRERIVWPSQAMEEVFWHALRIVRCAFWTSMICHVLLALWVFTDSQSSGGKKWFFVLLALLGGFLGAGVYALVRIGDRKG